MFAIGIEREQLFDQGESDPRPGRLIEPFELQLHVRVVIRFALENAVFFLEIEKRP